MPKVCLYDIEINLFRVVSIPFNFIIPFFIVRVSILITTLHLSKFDLMLVSIKYKSFNKSDIFLLLTKVVIKNRDENLLIK